MGVPHHLKQDTQGLIELQQGPAWRMLASYEWISWMSYREVLRKK